MRLLRWLTGLGVCLALAACGGGDDRETPLRSPDVCINCLGDDAPRQGFAVRAEINPPQFSGDVLMMISSNPEPLDRSDIYRWLVPPGQTLLVPLPTGAYTLRVLAMGVYSCRIDFAVPVPVGQEITCLIDQNNYVAPNPP